MPEPPLTGILRETRAVFEREAAPLTTPEVASRLDLGRRSTYDRLERLCEAGHLETKKVGANARVWWRPGVTAGTEAEEPNDGLQHREFESLVDSVEEYAIFSLDETGRVQSWNAGAERIKGYDAEEIVGDHFSTFYTPADRADAVPERNLATARAQGSVEEEGWRVRADGSQFWAAVTITAIRDDDGDRQGYVKVTRDMTERRERERRLRRERDITERLLETVPVQLFVFGPDGSTDRINSRARRDIGIEDGDAASFDFRDIDLYDEDGEPLAPDDYPVQQVLETGEPVRNLLLQYEQGDGQRRWLSVTASPVLVDGDIERVVASGNDVTDLKRSQERLERQRDEIERELRTVYERVDDAFFALDDDWQFVHVNEQAAEVLDSTEAELLGEPLLEAFPKAAGTRFQAEYERAVRTQESVTFEEYFEPLGTWVEVNAYPSEGGLSVYFRDVTERRESQQELEQARRRLRTLVDNFPNGAVALVDQDCRYVTVGGTPTESVPGSPGKLEGQRVSEALPAEAAELFVPCYEAAIRGETTTFEESVGGRTYDFRFLPVRNEDGGVVAAIGMSQDVTEHVERKRELERRVRQQAAVTELGHAALEETDVDALMARASAAVADTLDADYCKVLDLDRAANELFLRQGVGWQEGIVGDATVSTVEDDSQAAYTLASQEPVVVSDLEAETRFGGPALLTDHDVKSGISTIIGSYEDPWGILGIHDTERREFDPHDVAFIQSVANILAEAVARHADRDQLRQQREQLVALLSINSVVREITHAVIDQSSRVEIERTVCDLLADLDSFVFAWIGEADAATQTVELRAEAGVDGYLDGITISVDPEDERSHGPTGRAFRTGEVQVCHDIDGESQHDPWRSHFEDHDVNSSVAVPIVHDGTVYTVLNVYATRKWAFEGQERALLEQLGEVVGHAIASIERKHALMADEVVELEFRIPEFFAAFDMAADTDGRITVEDTIGLDNGEFLVYGSVSADGQLTLQRFAEAIAGPDALSINGAEGADSTYELQLAGPPILSTVASLGGTVDETVIQDGNCQVTIHLSPTADVRRLIDTIEERFPSSQLLKRHQITRRNESDDRKIVAPSLTDRQRTTLEAAYHAGFFEWPRLATGEEVADTIGIAPSTFHQHLRKAEQRIVDAVLARSDDESESVEGTDG